MKRILVFAVMLFLANLCYAQGFDKEMEKAGKEFHKNSKKAGKAVSKKPKKVSTLNGNRSNKKNRAKRKSSPSKG